MGVVKSQHSKTNKSKNPLDPILFLFDILGKLPLTRNKKGTLQFKLISYTVFRSVITTFVLIYLVIRIAIWKISHSKYWESFDKALNSVNDLLLFDTCFHAVLGTWRATPNIARAIERWNEFHTKLQMYTNRQVSADILKYTKIGVCLVLLYTGTLTGFYVTKHLHAYDNWFRNVKATLAFLCLIYYLSVVVLWIILCLMTITPAKILRDTLIQSLVLPPAPDVVPSLRQLWVELLGCTGDLVQAFGSTVQMWMLTNFLINLLSTYGVLMYLLVDSSIEVYYAPQGIFTTTCTTLVVFNLGHLAQQSISEDVLFKLFNRRWDKLSKTTRNELELVVDTIEYGRQSFSINGFINNRMGIVSLCQTSLTYLVVLMQLKTSATKI